MLIKAYVKLKTFVLVLDKVGKDHKSYNSIHFCSTHTSQKVRGNNNRDTGSNKNRTGVLAFPTKEQPVMLLEGSAHFLSCKMSSGQEVIVNPSDEAPVILKNLAGVRILFPLYVKLRSNVCMDIHFLRTRVGIHCNMVTSVHVMQS